MNQHRERQVLTPFALPRIAPAALPRRLVVRHDANTWGRFFFVRLLPLTAQRVKHEEPSPVFGGIPQPAVGGIGLFDMNNLKIHNPLAKIQNIL